MKSKSLLTAGIAALLGQTSTFEQAKGRGRTPSKNYTKGGYYSQKKGPFNTNQEQSRRLRQLARLQS